MKRAVRPDRLAGPRAVAEHGTTRPQGRTPLALPRHQGAHRSRVDPHSHEGTKTTGLQTATRAGYRQGHKPLPEPLMAMLPRNRNKGKPGEGLTPWLTGAGARSAEGTDIGHENAEGMAYVGVRVEPPVRLGREVEG